MLFASLFRAGPGPTDDFWYTPIWSGTPSAAGPRVSTESALRVSAVYACVRVIAESIASLPLLLYGRDGQAKRRVPEHPAYRLMHDAPNPWQTSYEWREQTRAHLLLRGNAYSVKIYDGAGRIEALWPLHPDRVTVVVDERRRRLGYQYQRPDGTTETYLPDEILHERGLSLDGVVGLSPIAYARESIGIALAAEEYGARFFANDATPRTVLYHPQHFKTKEAREEFSAAVQRGQTGANRGKTMLLEDGIKLEAIGMTHADAQFLEARKFQIAEVARLYRVPPHMIGDLERATNNNIEHQSIEFVMHTLRPLLVRGEQRYNQALLSDPERDVLFFEHLVDGLLRGDFKSRQEGLARAILAGYLTRNEAREIENRNPIEGLDEPLEPMNMLPAGTDRTDGAAARVARREVVAVSEAYAARQNGSLDTWAREYYGKLTRHVRQELGKGGMGRVFEAFDERLQRRVALKVLDQQTAQKPEFAAMFVRESQALAALQHPNIVAVHEAGQDGDANYIVMDVVDGVSLKDVLEVLAQKLGSGRPPVAGTVLDEAIARPLPPGGEILIDPTSYVRSVVRIVSDIARALEAAHARGVLHRDLKPSNVLLRGGGQPVLLDFGLAGWLDGDRTDPAQGLYGTCAYLAPEQVRQSRTGSDPKSDLYQLGLLLYEMLTLQRAFAGDDASELMERIVDGRFDRPRKIAQHLPRIGARKVMLTHMNERMLANRAKATGAGIIQAEDGLVVEL